VTRTLELPEQVYDALVEAARSRGVAPSEWIASRLPRPERPPVSEADREAARARLLRFAGTVSLGHPTGTDNEQSEDERRAALDRLFSHTVDMGRPFGTDNEGIDADLAREYLDPHEEP
jgi:hypothetical protein